MLFRSQHEVGHLDPHTEADADRETQHDAGTRKGGPSHPLRVGDPDRAAYSALGELPIDSTLRRGA